MASEAAGWHMVPRARKGRTGGLGTRTVGRPGGRVRWIGWSTVWEAARDMCGKRHVEQAQGYIATSTENSRAGGRDIHTNSIAFRGPPATP